MQIAECFQRVALRHVPAAGCGRLVAVITEVQRQRHAADQAGKVEIGGSIVGWVAAEYDELPHVSGSNRLGERDDICPLAGRRHDRVDGAQSGPECVEADIHGMRGGMDRRRLLASDRDKSPRTGPREPRRDARHRRMSIGRR